MDFRPLLPKTLEETGLKKSFLQDLVLKIIYSNGKITGKEISQELKLPASVTLEVIELLKKQKFIDGAGSSHAIHCLYEILDMGRGKVREIFERDEYIGPAPVCIAQYNQIVKKHVKDFTPINRDQVKAAFADLIIKESVFEEIGPAVNSRGSMFLFGPPGNGKTSIAERISRIISDKVLVPYAIEVDNQVIKLFDPSYHKLAEEEGASMTYDNRWLLCDPPAVVVGGELTLEELDLIWNPTAKFYEAPIHLKANGGMFLIDDFGRQIVRPRDLLNRWIVPLEKSIDFMTLHNGKKIEVPFIQLVVFSTNLDPADLVDEAFLRRLQNKIHILDPDEESYRKIFKLNCENLKIPYDEAMVSVFVDKYMKAEGRPFRACQPRDILKIIRAKCLFDGIEYTMNENLFQYACKQYYVKLA
ncbi:MAG: ATP-binding protein [Candidatus Wallbacteria bacterium]|nr:ATP-binding protein [Candidatus Wallbacteria bacterium]